MREKLASYTSCYLVNWPPGPMTKYHPSLVSPPPAINTFYSQSAETINLLFYYRQKKPYDLELFLPPSNHANVHSCICYKLLCFAQVYCDSLSLENCNFPWYKIFKLILMNQLSTISAHSLIPRGSLMPMGSAINSVINAIIGR